jgi:hypothetical protein
VFIVLCMFTMLYTNGWIRLIKNVHWCIFYMEISSLPYMNVNKNDLLYYAFFVIK